MTAATFRGYEPQTVPTADLKVGDRMYFPGASMLLAITGLTRHGDETAIYGRYEKFGRLRTASVWRKTAGRSTIHVPAATS